MKTVRILIVVGLITVFSICNLALAANTATQTLTFQVNAINELATSGNPAALIIDTAVAGSEPTTTNAATTYAITTNEVGKKITGSINSDMPAGTSLTINLGAPTGATSLGDVALSSVAADLVNGISKVAESGKTISYTFSATVAAGVIATDTRTVTLTITN